ncbi:MAG: HNH endonuclease [Halobacteriovorax sp.]|nr:HNH endonuclease [Halobacteriovorax sp.]|tara:strand:- start:4016 stop:4240 length:225 start_codon:yes stop_codon:yes gene_type:complete
MSKPRNYKKEYKATHGTKKGKLDRAARNKANRLKKPGRGKEVHHKNGNPRDNRPSNLSVISKKANRKKQPKRKA